MKRFAAWVIKFQKRIIESLTAKTFLILFALFITALTAVYFFTGLFLPFASEKQASRELFVQSENLVSGLRLRNENECGASFTDFLRETGAELFLLDANRKIVSDFAYGNYLPLPAEIRASSDRMREYPFRFADSTDEFILIVVYNPVITNELKSAVLNGLPWIAVVVLALGAMAAFLFSRYAARPIKRISEIAGHIADLDFSWYCPDVRGDEIGNLAHSINELSDKLDTALKDVKYRERRRVLFFSAVSHELKTPVATVIGQLEGMLAGVGVYKDRDKYLARSAEILRGLDGFIREILSVSHLDMKDGTSHKPVNLSEVIENSARKYGLTAETEPGVFILGDGELLGKAVCNIIANAVTYSPAGADVTVRLAKHGNQAQCQVINTGSHIDNEHLPHLFEPFYRTGTRGGGSGLGLYITGMILENHNAKFKIENCDGGVIFEAKFYLVS